MLIPRFTIQHCPYTAALGENSFSYRFASLYIFGCSVAC